MNIFDQFFALIYSIPKVFASWIAFLTTNDPWRQVITILVDASPVILCITLFLIFWKLWVHYVRARFFLEQEYSTLEIRLPKETIKSPLAMELFLSALHQTGGEANWFDKFWLGKTRAWFALEMISIEGQIHFFIWTRTAFKSFIESSLYAQFPGVEVHEMPDYAKSVHFDPNEMKLWGGEFKFTKPDPYPIKTYVDYGLDKDPKEEFKVDPLAPLLEFLGSIGVNQQVWIQILVRAHKDDQYKPGHIFKTRDKWKEQAMEEVNKIMARDPKTKVSGNIGEDGAGQRISISPGEQDLVKAIERSVSKLGYDVGIRTIYLGQKDSVVGTTIPGIIGSLKQFNTEHLNGFKVDGSHWSPKFNYPWQDFREYRQNKMRKHLLKMYKYRSYFYEPYIGTPMVMNSEELATIFHFPGQVAAAPTLSRIASKKGQAPANLPI